MNNNNATDAINGSIYESLQQSIATISDKADRSPTVDEERLSRLLIEQVIPPFKKSLSLQALVVYQADEEKMKCLLVNRTYSKTNDSLITIESDNGIDGSVDVECTQSSSFDSGFIDHNSSANPPTANNMAPMQPESMIDFTPNASSARRKRKLCRPCRIPQSDDVDSQPESDVKVAKFSSPIDLSQNKPSHTSIPVQSTETSSITSNGRSDGLILPVSAVTLLPRLGLFSLPVTVLSTLHRPILPKVEFGKHNPTTSTFFSVPNFLGVTSSTPKAVHSQVPSNTHSQSSVPPLRPQLAVTVTTTTSDTPSGHHNTNTTPSLPSANNGLDYNTMLQKRLNKSFVCNQCHAEFTSLNLLCSHTFSEHRGFRCTICRAQFTQRSNLQRHSLRHVGFKPFMCKVCEKAYYRKDHLVRHIELSHPGCDPRVNLTVKLTSAECLDYLDKLQNVDSVKIEQNELVMSEPATMNCSTATVTTTTSAATDSITQDIHPVNLITPSSPKISTDQQSEHTVLTQITSVNGSS